MVSLFLPQCVVVNAFSSLLADLALSCVVLMCLLKVSLGSKVRPSILGCLLVGIVWLLIASDRVLLFSAGSGVKSLEGLS